MKNTVPFLLLPLFIFCVLISDSDTASAQDEIAHWYAGIFGGYTLNPEASWENVDDYTYDLDIEKARVFGAKFGVCFLPTEYFACEFEYSYFNPDVDRAILTRAGDDYSAIEGEVKFHNFMINLIARYPAPGIRPYFGLGLGGSCFDLSITSSQSIDGIVYSARNSADDAVFAWQLLFGIDLDVTDTLSLDIGYRYFDASSLDDDYHYDVYCHNGDCHIYNDNYYRDDTTFDYDTGMFTIGLRLRF